MKVKDSFLICFIILTNLSQYFTYKISKVVKAKSLSDKLNKLKYENETVKDIDKTKDTLQVYNRLAESQSTTKENKDYILFIEQLINTCEKDLSKCHILSNDEYNLFEKTNKEVIESIIKLQNQIDILNKQV